MSVRGSGKQERGVQLQRLSGALLVPFGFGFADLNSV